MKQSLDSSTVFDYEEFGGYYQMQRGYLDNTKERRCWHKVDPGAVLHLMDAALMVPQCDDQDDATGEPACGDCYRCKIHKALLACEVTG